MITLVGARATAITYVLVQYYTRPWNGMEWNGRSAKPCTAPCSGEKEDFDWTETYILDPRPAKPKTRSGLNLVIALVR